MSKVKHLTLLTALTLAISGCNSEVVNIGRGDAQESKAKEIWPRIQSEVKTDAQVEAKVADILAGMTLEQKIAQMIQPEIRDITVDDMRRYGFGSFLNGGGAFPDNNKHATPADWINLAEQMYQASIDDSLDGSTIPTMWGTDAVHGHNNVIGATLFPHNIGLGAANNPELIEKIAQVTATEVMVTGIDWVFAPTVATVRDDRWGRTYEGYSEDPEIVKAYSAAIVKGLQGQPGKDFLADNRVISTVKHFLGDGGTVDGDDQGNNIASEQELFDIHAQGYVGGLTAGAQSVMASFNSWHGDKIHGNRYLLTNVLKEKMGFDGFVVGDWNGHGQIKGCSNDNCPQAINAGLDIYMAPTDAWKALLDNTIAQVKQGVIAQERIDDAVTRILRVKVRAGIFEKPSPANRPFSGKLELIGHVDHREIARQAVRESLVLLKNKQNTLPLSPKLSVLVAGDAADNIGKQSGGWTITWQGTNNTNADFPGGSSIYQGIAEQVTAAGGQVALSVDGSFTAKPDVAIVVFGEEPYAEGHGDLADLNYQAETKRDLALLTSLKAQGIPVVSVFISGRPLWVNAELNASDAFVAAWLPGSEGAAIAEVLFTDATGNVQHDFSGKLSFSWPKSAEQAVVNRNDADYQPLLPYGFGLAYGDSNLLADNLPEGDARVKQISTNTVVFDKAVNQPWQFALASGEQHKVIDSSAVNLAGISFRTIDRFVQEDAFALSLEGQADSHFVIDNRQLRTKDYQALLADDAAINIELELQALSDAPVVLAMACDTGSDCQTTSVDLQPTLAQLSANEWQRIAIPLSCFKSVLDSGHGKVMPLTLASIAPLELNVFNITLAAPVEGSQQISCQ